MIFYYKLDENKNPVPCSNIEAESQYRDFENYRRVALTEFVDGSSLSTVFLVIDHRHIEEDHPVLFESMYFCDGDDNDQDLRRYCSWREALKGHEAWVKEIGKKVREK